MKKEQKQATILWSILGLLGYFLLYFLQGIGVFNLFVENIFIFIGINIILATGLNLIIGFSGQFSLGHAGFMAIGAYATSLLLMGNPSIIGLLVGLIVGCVLAGGVAFLVGGPTLRLKGDYLAIATLGISEIIRILLINMPKLTSGAAGLFHIPNIVTWPVVYVAVFLVTILTANYVHSMSGLVTLGVAENEIASESLGVNTTKYKLQAFIIGAMTASIAGGLYASYLQTIAPKDFTFNKSIDILIIVVFGGIGSLTGSVIAAIVLGVLNMFLQGFGALRMIIYAVALLLMMLFRPKGLLGKKEFSLEKILTRKKEVIK